MTTLAMAKKEALKHGADLLTNRSNGEAEAWLPEGQMWNASMARCIVVSFGYTGAGVMPQVYAYLIDDMSQGIW